MSTVTNLKHLMSSDVFKIKTKVKAFQKPKRYNRSNNKRVRG